MKYDVVKKWYFWYADTSETNFGSDEKNRLNSTYGIYELVQDEDGNADYEAFYKIGKVGLFILSYRWQVFRNGVWNKIERDAPVDGIKSKIEELINEGEGGFWGWRNKAFFGKQLIKWVMNGKQHFRYSFTRDLKKYSPIRLLGYKYVNFMIGTSDNRYLIKARYFDIKEVKSIKTISKNEK